MGRILKCNLGFTLIEMIVVIVILGVLAGIGVPQLMDAINNARVTTMVTNVATIDKIITQIYAETGCLDGQSSAAYPDSVIEALNDRLAYGKRIGEVSDGGNMAIYITENSDVDNVNKIVRLYINWDEARIRSGVIFAGKPGYTWDPSTKEVHYIIDLTNK